MQFDDFQHGRDVVLRDGLWHAGGPRIVIAGERPQRVGHARALFVSFAGHDRRDRATQRPAFHAVVTVAVAHDERAEIRVTEPERAKNM